MNLRTARLCAVALFVTLLVSACGTGGDDGRATGKKGQYVAQVDPVCVDLHSKVGELGQEPEKQAADVEAAVMKIREVAKPAEDSEIADRFIAALENLYLGLQDVDQSQRVNDQPRKQKALDGLRINNETAAKSARAYGMVGCARLL